MTEQYSAFKAEVPCTDDPQTLLNKPLMNALSAQSATLLVAGEALSHCVAASVGDMMAELPSERLLNTVLLTDCMSPVTGFEEAGQAFLAQARTRGLRTCSLGDFT
jgi:nicotinamidase-related amidase